MTTLIRPTIAVHFEPELMHLIHTGTKAATMRLGHRDIRPGDRLVLMEKHRTYLPFHTTCKDVVHATVGKLNVAALKALSCSSHEDLARRYQRHYPGIDLKSEVTLVTWGDSRC